MATFQAFVSTPESIPQARLAEVLALLRRPGRRFWYLARTDNVASIAVCRKAGFVFAGEAFRASRFGSQLLGQFVLDSGGVLPRPRVVAG